MALQRSANYVILLHCKLTPTIWYCASFVALRGIPLQIAKKPWIFFMLNHHSSIAAFFLLSPTQTCQCTIREHFCMAVYQSDLHWDVVTTSSLEMLSWVFVHLLCIFTFRELCDRNLASVLTKIFSNFTLSKTIKSKIHVLTEQNRKRTHRKVCKYDAHQGTQPKSLWDMCSSQKKLTPYICPHSLVNWL